MGHGSSSKNVHDFVDVLFSIGESVRVASLTTDITCHGHDQLVREPVAVRLGFRFKRKRPYSLQLELGCDFCPAPVDIVRCSLA